MLASNILKHICQSSISSMMKGQSIAFNPNQFTQTKSQDKDDFKYQVGLKIYDKVAKNKQNVLLVKKKGDKDYSLPKMKISKGLEQKSCLNEAKMNLFQQVSLNQWKVFFMNLDPKYSKECMEEKVKTLYFEATKFDKCESIVNPELYESFKWVPASQI